MDVRDINPVWLALIFLIILFAVVFLSMLLSVLNMATMQPINAKPNPPISAIVDITSTTLAPKIIYVNKTNILNKTVLVNKTRYINRTLELYEFVNVSAYQKRLIQNLKAPCHTIGCNEGYFKCKEDIQDILGWDKSRFKERASAGFDPLDKYKKPDDSKAVFIVKNDNFADYIEFNASIWHFNHPMINHSFTQDYNELFVNLTPNQIVNNITIEWMIKDVFNRSVVIARKIR